MPLFLAFLLVPLIEIGLFIQVGGAIGLWPTLIIVVITAVLGTYLVKSQGRQAIARLSGAFNELRDPTQPLADGAMILLAGALLLTPGFFTDAVGFALLMPPVRQALYRYVAARVTVQSFASHSQTRSSRYPGANPGDDDIIDGDFTEVRPREPGQPPSAWVEKDDENGSGRH